VSEITRESRTIAAGAGWAGDRIEPAVALAGSGIAEVVVLECLAERTIVAGLRARAVDPESGFDRRLERRFRPLLPVAAEHGCKIVSNLGSANPAAAARATTRLARELGLELRVAAVVGDDCSGSVADIDWTRDVEGTLIGAHAYLGSEAIAEALAGGADVVLTGRCSDSALFLGPVASTLDGSDDALAGALAVGHLLECSAQVSGGNYEPPGGPGLDGESLATMGYPLARVAPDGTAELFILDGEPARLDRTSCTLQLLYEVHDPSAYITPDGTLDFTGITFEELGHNRVRVSGARLVGRPERLKVSGFVERPGYIMDVEVAYAGDGALERAGRAVELLRRRLDMFGPDEILVDLVGVDSVLGERSPALQGDPPEVRVHVSAACPDDDSAQNVEDEVIGLTLSGPAGAGGIRSERRPRVEAVDGFIDRDAIETAVVWGEEQ
jgi:hypothetical protein